MSHDSVLPEVKSPSFSPYIAMSLLIKNHFPYFQDSMSELRALCYPGTDVLLLCFSRARPETFRSVAGRWARAVKAVGAPVILVATQSDLAGDTSLHQHLSVGTKTHLTSLRP